MTKTSKKNTVIEVLAEKIVFPGNVLCRCADGIALFCEGLLPGETAEVFVTRDKKTFREGKLKNILSKSPLRKEPECPSFGKCGGCSFQHTDYKTQTKFKTECVRELLNFTETEISDIIESPLQWEYRNKMEFSFFDDNGKLDMGLHEKGSFYKYIGIPPCFIAHKDIVKTAAIVKEFCIKTGLKPYNNKSHEGFFRHLVLRKGINTGDLSVNLVTNKTETIKDEFWSELTEELKNHASSVYWTHNSKFSDAVNSEISSLLYGSPNITESLTVYGKTLKFSIAPFSFFQTNTKAAEILYDTVIKCLDPKKEDCVLDMYCGTGSIGICLAPHVKRVTGVEQIEDSIKSARQNAVLNAINNISFFASTAENWIKQNTQKFDAVIIDPPRMGLTQPVIEHILDLAPEKIVYVSCNPSTLARDLKIIYAAGGYAAEKIIPVDMFPQTYHIETVVLLSKT